jgi:hypothetical protein
MLNNRGDLRVKLTADAGVTDEEKEVFFLQQYQKFERYVYWFLGEMVFKTTATAWTITKTTC